ncbi:MAG: CDP-diacylglycerol--glycerol-3-phosphate 3-phosphatidyltransferase [Candidatus Hydrogenedentes bacterium]|nr:CDP-diacylglycerol--glycerol-3-phosphate 3-phosphatidyltransferase [Candidatus Hydrogenedentota bacterium]
MDTPTKKNGPQEGAAGKAEALVLNLPNQLTLLRLLMTPVLLALLSIDLLVCYAAGYALFIAATITDYYDGKIARTRNLISNFGKLIDPLADKILISTVFIMMIGMPDLAVPRWTVVVIIAREFLVTGARSLAASEGVIIPANKYGKTKAVLQMVYVHVFLGLLIIKRVIALWFPVETMEYAWVLQETSLWAIIFVALYTVYSGVRYAQLNWHVLRLGS